MNRCLAPVIRRSPGYHGSEHAVDRSFFINRPLRYLNLAYISAVLVVKSTLCTHRILPGVMPVRGRIVVWEWWDGVRNRRLMFQEACLLLSDWQYCPLMMGKTVTLNRGRSDG
jgi:hypothetical protein